ncbi:MAG TPA: penicillin-binding protein 1C [Saprospiraceae bacterium]|nr:penicillin-binding protein 1C [Saprospiraceae bacterium]
MRAWKAWKQLPLKKRRKLLMGFLVLFLLLYWFSLPRKLFDVPRSLVLEDRNGQLLGARIATDGQWRFPPSDSVPDKFVQAIIAFEDKRFYRHPGVDPLSLGRAFFQNIRAGRIVSGGSTLSMQVIRMSKNNPPRTIYQKLKEMLLATRLELGYSKSGILNLYASNAPFGGNVVGIEAASWRYFGKKPALLSWAEAATLAVLPNSPALIHPGRNRDRLMQKRNALLDRLCQQGRMDSLSLELAKEEPLPEAPLPLPQLAPHLLDRAYTDLVTTGIVRNARIRTTLDIQLQRQLNELVAFHQYRLSGSEIHNLAAIVLDVPKGEVLAYVGNVAGIAEEHGPAVDVITAPRSTGSIMKPWLYAMSLQDGLVAPSTLLPDIPTQLSGYRPENFNKKFDGLVPAQMAISRSLNVPLVYLLQRYGLEKFHYNLQKWGCEHILFPPQHYGLPLVLGGAEASLWEITNIYAGMARTLNTYTQNSGQYQVDDFLPATYLLPKEADRKGHLALQQKPVQVSAGAVWLSFQAMEEVERPDSEGDWMRFESSRPIAWKTGTSFGFRDAWAVGVNPQYAVGIWAGNADGEGRPGLVGIRAAAPVLFDVFNRLPGEQEWFKTPYDDLEQLALCRESGYKAGPHCQSEMQWVTSGAVQNLALCPYHQQLHLDASGQWRVSAACYPNDQMQVHTWMVLPPIEEFYYKLHHPNFKPLPLLYPDCQSEEAQIPNMQLIYPRFNMRIFVPVDLDGQPSKTVFSAAHRQPEASIHWHIDAEYVGTTTHFHTLACNPAPGRHVLSLVDEYGQRIEQAFEVVE